MNNLNDVGVSERSRDFIDTATDKAQVGVDKTLSTLSDTAQSVAQRGKPVLDQVTAATSKLRDSAASVSDSFITFTRENPAKGLIIAAAAGGLVLTLMRALLPSRD